MSRIASLGGLILLAVALPAAAQEAAAYKTPQECFDAGSAAFAKGDHKTWVGCLVPQSQKDLAVEFAVEFAATRAALAARSKGWTIIRWCTSASTMRKRTRSGRANVCPPKPSSNSRRAAVWTVSVLPGVMNSNRAVGSRRIHFRDIFLTRTPGKTASSAQRRSAASTPTALDYSIWPVTFGSGVPIGTDRITTRYLRRHSR